MNKNVVVIPYLAQEAQGDELVLAISGWRQHFLEPYHILLVGDYHPIARATDITYIHCPRIDWVKGDNYLPHLDHLHKFLTVLEALPEDVTSFIFTCDDYYAVKDFTLEDVARPKVAQLNLPHFDWKRERDFWRDIGKTRDFCEAQGWPTHNWTCHLPMLYDVPDFLECVNLVPKDESFVWENIYFNRRQALYEKYAGMGRRVGIAMPELEQPIVLNGRNAYKYEVLTDDPGIDTAEEAGSIWITNGNCGWSRKLESILREHYFYNSK